jgi:hypothetical protein
MPDIKEYQIKKDYPADRGQVFLLASLTSTINHPYHSDKVFRLSNETEVLLLPNPLP